MKNNQVDQRDTGRDARLGILAFDSKKGCQDQRSEEILEPKMGAEIKNPPPSTCKSSKGTKPNNPIAYTGQSDEGERAIFGGRLDFFRQFHEFGLDVDSEPGGLNILAARGVLLSLTRIEEWIIDHCRFGSLNIVRLRRIAR